MKAFVLLPLLFVLIAPAVAHAQNGNAFGHDKGAVGNGNANGQDKDDNPGNGKDKQKAPGASSPGRAATDQDAAMEAVKSGRALPLSEIVRRAVANLGGRVIDARLLTVGNRLVYRLTMVTDAGASRQVLLDARTAAQLQVK